MKIRMKQIKVKDIVKGYIDQEEEGVYGFDGKLNIRPKYQREFVYDDVKQKAVIYTIMKGFPLNVMYWAKNSSGSFEVLDGQQRTLSICKFINGDFHIKDKNGASKYFHTLSEEEQEIVLDYELMVYICEGNDTERLEWFRTINIAGEKLTDQELLNANYTGEWLTDAKKKFSKTNCPAMQIGKDYIKGSSIRQEILETVLDWISDGNIMDYMAKHQFDTDANEMFQYFNSVISWAKSIFPKVRKELKQVNWGKLYKQYKDNQYNAEELEAEINRLMADDDVTAKKGVYEYLLSGKTNERVLSIRAFTDTQKRTAYERQQGICPICGEHYEFSEMEGDHIIPWSKGGKTTTDNLQMLCRKCNGDKSNH